MAYYHASRKIGLKPGDIIYPAFNERLGKKAVFLVSKPGTHFTLWMRNPGENVGERRYNLYKVHPIKKVKAGLHYAELYTEGPCVVVACLGEAPKRKGIYEQFKAGHKYAKKGQTFLDQPNDPCITVKLKMKRRLDGGKPMSNRKRKRHK
jgi:hypothetical protein